jgi:hypothetical protein
MARKMARICWNTNNWKKPSGCSGKSTSEDTYEYQYDFGHEEWLFDLEKLIDGYHYGYLTPIQKYWDTYQGETLKIRLYTYNSDDRDWYWVGWLNSVEVISRDERDKVREEYQKRGWIDLMKEEVAAVGAHYKDPDSPGNCFNIKFKPSDIALEKNGLQLFDEDQKVNNTRYMLLNYDTWALEVGVNSGKGGIR